MFTTALTSAFLDIALKLSLRPVSPTPSHKEISYGCLHLDPQEKLSNFFMYCPTFLYVYNYYWENLKKLYNFSSYKPCNYVHIHLKFKR